MMRLLLVITMILLCGNVEAHTISGKASWYGKQFAGRKTCNGEIFDPHKLTAANKTLPIGSIVRVRYKKRSVVVRINDHGPYVGNRILDLSERAATEIGLHDRGVGTVEITVLSKPHRQKHQQFASRR
jgi:rare lipoprotein A